MNIEQIPPKILATVTSRGYDTEQIEAMEPRDLFHHYCQWNGLIGWSDDLWNVVSFLSKE